MVAGSTLAWLVAGLAAAAAAVLSVALVRARRAARRALGERGWLLERERHIGAEAAVGAERARIARELHDIVSHNVSLMVVQANAAREVMAVAGAHTPTPPDAAQALHAVEVAGRGALSELRNLLGLLAPVADGDGDDLAPQPSLDRLSGLVDRIAFAGLPVEVRISGEPRPLPAGVDVTAYRIVQEALTNALKHGRASSAEVTIRYAERSLRVEVLNSGPSVLSSDGPAPSRPRTEHDLGNGRGLLGLRERVAVYGGELDARRRLGGGFRVRARIPLDWPGSS